MGACNVILLVNILILNVFLLSVLSQSDASLECDIPCLEDVIPVVIQECVVEPIEGVVVFGGNVPAHGRVSISGQSSGFSENVGFQQWTTPYPTLEAPYIFIPTAYGPIPVPVPNPEFIYPYIDSYPTYPAPIQYPGPSPLDVYLEENVYNYDYLVPVSGRVSIGANFGNCDAHPYPYQATCGNFVANPPVAPDFYYNYFPELQVEQRPVVKARGEITISAKF